jgi:hypothetical protein
MSGPNDRDRSLDEYLRGDSPVSRAYREEAQELPPAHLDARILAEASRAGAAAQRVAKSPFSSNWMVPASLAAVLVLTVSVVVLLQFEQPRFDYAPEPAIESKTPAEPARQRADRAVPEEIPDAAYSTPAPELEKQQEKTVLPAMEAPAPSADGVMSGGRLISGDRAAPRKSENGPPPASPAVAPALKMYSPAEATRDDAAEEMDQGKKSKARKEVYLQSAPAAAEASKRESRAGRAAGQARMPTLDAEAWLARIEALIAEGSLDEAAAQLREFRAMYPQAEIPETILSRLGNAVR